MPRMGRCNRYLRFIMKQVNFNFGLLGLGTIGISLYIMFAKWGDVDPSFFFGTGLTFCLFGVFLTSLGCLGCLSVNFQEKVVGFWIGKRILYVLFFVLVAALAAEIWAVQLSLTAYTSIKYTYDILSTLKLEPGTLAIDGPPLDGIEKLLSQKFNAFSFAAFTSECSEFNQPDLKYSYFWLWLDGHCSTGMTSTECLKCNSNAISSCYADAGQCYGADDGDGQGCPYNLCRVQILDYLLNKFGPISYYVLAFCIFTFILLIISILMMCYNPRDTLAIILEKSGNKENHSELNVHQVQEDFDNSRYSTSAFPTRSPPFSSSAPPADNRPYNVRNLSPQQILSRGAAIKVPGGNPKRALSPSVPTKYTQVDDARAREQMVQQK